MLRVSAIQARSRTSSRDCAPIPLPKPSSKIWNRCQSRNIRTRNRVLARRFCETTVHARPLELDLFFGRPGILRCLANFGTAELREASGMPSYDSCTASVSGQFKSRSRFRRIVRSHAPHARAESQVPCIRRLFGDRVDLGTPRRIARPFRLIQVQLFAGRVGRYSGPATLQEVRSFGLAKFENSEKCRQADVSGGSNPRAASASSGMRKQFGHHVERSCASRCPRIFPIPYSPSVDDHAGSPDLDRDP